MSGYFQRLAKRSGVGGRPVPDRVNQPARAAINEVEEVHQVAQPAATINPEQRTETPLPTSPSVAPSQTVELERTEPQPTFENARSGHSNEKAEETSRAYLPETEHKTTESRVEEVAQPSFKPIEYEPSLATEEKKVEAEPTVATEDLIAEMPGSEVVFSQRPADTHPSFIRQEKTVTETERVMVRSVVEPETSAYSQPETTTAEPEFLQTQVRIEPSPPVPTDLERRPETKDNESGPRIHIGQIQVEVHTPPSQPALQAAPKPTPRPSRPAKPQTRNPDLRRYYLRGF